MKYNQPFDQPSNPNAPYVDGNPSAGIQGSIVPAASIEHDQREIVNAIAAAGLLPASEDLTQLLQMMKIMDVFNHFKVGVNQGSASQWSTAIPSLPIMPPPVGTTIWFKPGYVSVVGGAVFSVNGSPFAQVVHGDLSPITEGDINDTGWLLLFYDGVHWQIANAGGASTRQVGSPSTLQKNAHWYVNGATGNDTTLDGTSATIDSATVGPFKTIQRATVETLKYNQNGYDQYIHVANGSYVGPVNFKTLNGAGKCYVVGNPASPGSVAVAGAAPPYDCAFFQSGGEYDYNGFRLSTPGLDGIATTGGRSRMGNMQFGPCGRFHLGTGGSGAMSYYSKGAFIIEAGANAQAHVGTILAGLSSFPNQTPADWPTLNILGAVSFSYAFIWCVQLGVSQLKWTTITGAANVTGAKYRAEGNGVVDSIGSATSYYPGSAAGVLLTGGQYV